MINAGMEVLNLIINGIPSIQYEETLKDDLYWF